MKRDETIDIGKGVLIVLVVIGHLPIPIYWKNLIYSFHIPLFLFLSGYAWNPHYERSFGKCIKIELKKLYIPYLIFAMLHRVIVIVCQGGYLLYKNGSYDFFHSFIQSCQAILYGTIGFKDINFGPAWYLLVLLMIRLVWRFLDNKVLIIRLFFALFIFIIGFILSREEKMLPLSIVPVFISLLFFVTGREVRRQKFLERIRWGMGDGIKIMICCMAMSIILIDSVFIQEHVEIATGEIGKPLCIIFLNTVFCYCIIISGVIDKLRINKLFAYLGRNSIYIMGIHLSLYCVMDSICGFFDIKFNFLLGIIYMILGVIIPIELRRFTMMINALKKG